MDIKALCDEFSEVIENQLYLSNIKSAFNQELLQKHNISSVVTCTNLPLPIKYQVKGIEYRHFKCDDCSTFRISVHFLPFLLYLRSRIGKGPVLVHCRAGISRSPTLVLSYLMVSRKLSFRRAFDFLKERREAVCPNEGFRRQLKRYRNRLKQRSISRSTKPKKVEVKSEPTYDSIRKSVHIRVGFVPRKELCDAVEEMVADAKKRPNLCMRSINGLYVSYDSAVNECEILFPRHIFTKQNVFGYDVESDSSEESESGVEEEEEGEEEEGEEEEGEEEEGESGEEDSSTKTKIPSNKTSPYSARPTPSTTRFSSLCCGPVDALLQKRGEILLKRSIFQAKFKKCCNARMVNAFLEDLTNKISDQTLGYFFIIFPHPSSEKYKLKDLESQILRQLLISITRHVHRSKKPPRDHEEEKEEIINDSNDFLTPYWKDLEPCFCDENVGTGSYFSAVKPSEMFFALNQEEDYAYAKFAPDFPLTDYLSTLPCVQVGGKPEEVKKWEDVEKGVMIGNPGDHLDAVLGMEKSCCLSTYCFKDDVEEFFRSKFYQDIGKKYWEDFGVIDIDVCVFGGED